MGLYLCVFADDETDEDLEGVDVGSYACFNAFRTAISDQLEPAGRGTRFPVLMSHADSDGVWSPAEVAALAAELEVIRTEAARRPPVHPDPRRPGEARRFGSPASLLESFLDVDGEPVVERLIELTLVARFAGREIMFQ